MIVKVPGLSICRIKYTTPSVLILPKFVNKAVPVPSPVPILEHEKMSPTVYVKPIVPAIVFHCGCVVVPKSTILYELDKVNDPAVNIPALNTMGWPTKNPAVLVQEIILVTAVELIFVIAIGCVIALLILTILATVAGFTNADIEPDAEVTVIGTPPTVVATVNLVELKIPTT